ncbi:peptidase [Russula aff. rugulosa BPL654]|nr:peptidase [Russula aff. rugulosa BPL654]
MKSLLALLLLATAVTSIPATFRVHNVPEYALPVESPEDFDWDLQEMRLVQLAPDAEPIHAKAAGLKFIDITEAEDLGTLAPAALTFGTNRPFSPAFQKPNASKAVKKVIEELSTKALKRTRSIYELPHSSYCDIIQSPFYADTHLCYYFRQTGRESQKWLSQRIQEITSKFAARGLRDLITISEFPHSWGQNTIVVRINGSAPTDEGVVIVGAHQDSTNILPFLPAPGADDDGSGTVTILEAYRALITSDFRPVEHIEFHWYSAEEGGLLGSQAVAKEYEARGVNVIAMSQFDMTAWVKEGTREEVGIITDFVDPEVTALNKRLVDTYLDIPFVETKCGYACSDHASWSKAGYRSSFTIESKFENSNKNIHSARDRIDISPEFSFTHMLEFSKLTVAFVIELGGWTKSE